MGANIAANAAVRIQDGAAVHDLRHVGCSARNRSSGGFARDVLAPFAGYREVVPVDVPLYRPSRYDVAPARPPCLASRQEQRIDPVVSDPADVLQR